MKSTHNMMTAEQQKQKEQLTKQTFELSTLRSVLLIVTLKYHGLRIIMMNYSL